MQMKTMGKRALAAVCALLLCVSMMGMATPASAASVDIPQTVDSLEIGYTLPLSAGQAGVSWSSSDPAVATVDQNGVVTGHSMGKATITATYGGQSDSCTVSVGFLNGIDVSHHNVTDWDAIAASGVDFVMIRVGYGWEGDQVDREFVNNVKGAYEHGIPFGLYFYSYAGTESTPAEEDAQKEADYCLWAMERIQPYLDGMVLPVAYDLEEDVHRSMSGEQLGSLVKIFADALREEGLSTMVYTSDSIICKLDMEELAGQGISFWDAYYIPDDELDFTKQLTMGSSTPGWDTGVVPDIWQYASDGRNPGVGGGQANTDLDLIYLDMDSAKDQLKEIAQPDVNVSGSTATLSFAARTLYLDSYNIVKLRDGQVLTVAEDLPRCTLQYTDNDYQAGDVYYLNCNLNPLLTTVTDTYYGLHPGNWDMEGTLNVGDVMNLAQAVLDNSKLPQNSYFRSDWNNDQVLDVLDVMTLTQQLFWYTD